MLYPILPLQTISVDLGTVLLAVGSFLAGYALGHVSPTRLFTARAPEYRELIVAIIALVWTFSVIADVFVPNYQTPIYIHLIMGAVAGYLFGIENPIFSSFSERKSSDLPGNRPEERDKEE